MRAIWKFPLPLGRQVLIEMPRASKILSVGKSGDGMCVWAMVYPNETTGSIRRLRIYGTGEDIPDNVHDNRYIGTVTVDEFVCHVFDLSDSGVDG